MSSFQKLLLITAACLVASLVCVQAEIKATAILFRHGERTPVSGYNGIECAISQEIGEGQLTRVSCVEKLQYV